MSIVGLAKFLLGVGLFQICASTPLMDSQLGSLMRITFSSGASPSWVLLILSSEFLFLIFKMLLASSWLIAVFHLLHLNLLFLHWLSWFINYLAFIWLLISVWLFWWIVMVQKFHSEGGFFNAIMTFPEDYPNSPPTVKFTSEMWHPNGELSC